jgi:Carboxypeptidase regulatory-like domain
MNTNVPPPIPAERCIIDLMLRNFAILIFAMAFVLATQSMPRVRGQSPEGGTPNNYSAVALAAKPSPGKIKGEVIDINKAKVSGAVITIECKDFPRQLRTNDNGEFETSLPADTYRIRVEANGFDRFVSRPFKLKSGKTQRFNIEMHVAKPIGLMPAAAAPPSLNF